MSPESDPTVRVNLIDEVIEVIRGGGDTATIAQTARVQVSLIGLGAALPEAVNAPESSAMVHPGQVNPRFLLFSIDEVVPGIERELMAAGLLQKET